MVKIIHPLAGVVAIMTIATFWLSTAPTDLFAFQAIVKTVKTTILWGFLLLVPAFAQAGGSGFALSNGRRIGLVGMKAKRMPVIAANGSWFLYRVPGISHRKRVPANSMLHSTSCKCWNSLRVP